MLFIKWTLAKNLLCKKKEKKKTNIKPSHAEAGYVAIRKQCRSRSDGLPSDLDLHCFKAA